MLGAAPARQPLPAALSALVCAVHCFAVHWCAHALHGLHMRSRICVMTPHVIQTLSWAHKRHFKRVTRLASQMCVLVRFRKQSLLPQVTWHPITLHLLVVHRKAHSRRGLARRFLQGLPGAACCLSCDIAPPASGSGVRLISYSQQYMAAGWFHPDAPHSGSKHASSLLSCEARSSHRIDLILHTRLCLLSVRLQWCR